MMPPRFAALVVVLLLFQPRAADREEMVLARSLATTRAHGLLNEVRHDGLVEVRRAPSFLANGLVVLFCVSYFFFAFVGLWTVTHWFFLTKRKLGSPESFPTTAVETKLGRDKCVEPLVTLVEKSDRFYRRPEGMTPDEKKLGPLEEVLPVPEDESNLDHLLREEGIDTFKWGDSFAILHGQLLRGECWLAHERKSGRLVRRLRLIVVHIFAFFPVCTMDRRSTGTPPQSQKQGLNVLKCICSCDNSTGKIRAVRMNCATKVKVHDDFDEKLPSLLLRELSLPIEWQQKYLRVVRKQTTNADSIGGERGTSFPGLPSEYFNEEVWVVVGDINAKGIGGNLLLPTGMGQLKIHDKGKNKIRWWEWTEPTEEEKSCPALADEGMAQPA